MLKALVRRRDDIRQLAAHEKGRLGVVGAVLGLNRVAVSGEDERRLVLNRGGASKQALERVPNLAGGASHQVDFTHGKDRTRYVALVLPFDAWAEFLDGGGVEVERFEKLKRELGGVERGLGELGDLFFDFDRIHSDGTLSSDQRPSAESE